MPRLLRWSLNCLLLGLLAGCGQTTFDQTQTAGGCSGPADCPEGFMCREGLCVRVPSMGFACQRPEECGSGYACKLGQCVGAAPCSDLDRDGFCDRRDQGDDCNDNRADIHPGAQERCDQLDNNCNGEIDEGCECQTGKTKPCGSNLGICRKGKMTCLDGTWGACEEGIPPETAEVCGDKRDNDCDGQVDEGCGCEVGQRRDCGVAVGVCTVGEQLCEVADGGARWSDCRGGTLPTDEVCGDELDNDCDGAVDNGCSCEGKERPCGVYVGRCRAGIQRCRQGVWQGCEGGRQPELEICDGFDNDCDRQVDEGCECLDGRTEACGASAVGECREGRRRCQEGRFGACEGSVEPSPERCDGKDNDCDGQVDEDFPELRTSCQVGLGACQRAGLFVCKKDGSGVECNAAPGPGAAEVCDNQDNDCDGQVDEEVPGTGVACAKGMGQCLSAGLTRCGPSGSIVCDAPSLLPQVERCDGLDNDCDGTVDENFPQLALVCAVGVGECRAEGRYACTADGAGVTCDVSPGAPGVEVCNGRDDDCDGRVDEELSRACSSPCETGYQFCRDGAWSACTARQPTPDTVCDGIDNDCDGQVDEHVARLGEPCEAGIGACRSLGFIVCDGQGGTRCNAVSGTPQEEKKTSVQGIEEWKNKGKCCDGIDNDCDGKVDLADTPDCGGVQC